MNPSILEHVVREKQHVMSNHNLCFYERSCIDFIQGMQTAGLCYAQLLRVYSRFKTFDMFYWEDPFLTQELYLSIKTWILFIANSSSVYTKICCGTNFALFVKFALIFLYNFHRKRSFLKLKIKKGIAENKCEKLKKSRLSPVERTIFQVVTPNLVVGWLISFEINTYPNAGWCWLCLRITPILMAGKCSSI